MEFVGEYFQSNFLEILETLSREHLRIPVGKAKPVPIRKSFKNTHQSGHRHRIIAHFPVVIVSRRSMVGIFSTRLGILCPQHISRHAHIDALASLAHIFWRPSVMGRGAFNQRNPDGYDEHINIHTFRRTGPCCFPVPTTAGGGFRLTLRSVGGFYFGRQHARLMTHTHSSGWIRTGETPSTAAGGEKPLQKPSQGCLESNTTTAEEYGSSAKNQVAVGRYDTSIICHLSRRLFIYIVVGLGWVWWKRKPPRAREGEFGRVGERKSA